MSPKKASIRIQRIRRTSVLVWIETLETRVPVSEGIGPLLTISALAALGESGLSSALITQPQVVHFDNLTSIESDPDSMATSFRPELASSRPTADLPRITQQPVAHLPVASLVANEAEFFQALPAESFAANRSVAQARPLRNAQEPVAVGLGSWALTERAPELTRPKVADHIALNGRAEEQLLEAIAALRVGNPGDRGSGARGIEYIPVDLSYTPVFPKTARALASQPFTYEFKAEVDVNVLPITPCQLGQPTWQWGVGAGYSSSPAGPFVDPPYGSWSHSISSPNSPETPVTFTTQSLAHWQFVVGVTVQYQDSCANVWTGGGNVTLVESTFAAQAPPFTIASKPNSDIAIRNEYVEQIQTAAVLKGWQARYQAPGDALTQWQYRRVGEQNWEWVRSGGVIVQANPLEITYDQLIGEFEVRFARGAQFDQFSEVRRIMVIEPQLASFNVTAPGQYTRAGYHVNRSMDPAARYSGAVSATPASPTSDKIRWGFVQSVAFLMDVTLNWDAITWSPNTPDGTTVRFPSRFSFPSAPGRKNDAPLGEQLYGGSDSFPLSPNVQTQSDTPLVPNSFPRRFPDSRNKDTTITYDRNQYSGSSWNFVTWAVIFNLETRQYTPLRQIPWTLNIDTRQTGPWVASVGSGADPTKPIEATETVDRYTRPAPGPFVTITAPQTRP